MKKLVVFVFLVSLMLCMSAPQVLAQQQTYWHSNDYYDVELSGTGNAFVVANINLESLSDKGVSSITLEIPYNKVQIYKLLQNGGCWYPPCMEGPCPVYESKCYEPAFLKYTTETLADSTLVKINLTYPVTNNSQTSIYLVFSTPRIAKETFQGFEFSFKTIQDSNALIRYVGAGITVPENMQLKGKPSLKFDYRPSELATMTASSAKDFIGMIRYPYGGYQYSGQNLLPGESFTVSGLYGENFFLLYIGEILAGIFGLLIVVVIFFLFMYSRVKKMFARRPEERRLKSPASFSFGRALLVGIGSGFIFVIALF